VNKTTQITKHKIGITKRCSLQP